jgi:hypothetical protein
MSSRIRACNSSSEAERDGALGALLLFRPAPERRPRLTNEVTRFVLKAAIFFKRAREMDEFLTERSRTRFALTGFVGDRSALLGFDCLAKVTVKMTAKFATCSDSTTDSYHCAEAGEN